MPLKCINPGYSIDIPNKKRNSYYDSVQFPQQIISLLGCQNTPAKGSRYCPLHCNTAMVFRDNTLPDEMMSNGSHCNKPGSLIVSGKWKNNKTRKDLWGKPKKLHLTTTNLMVHNIVVQIKPYNASPTGTLWHNLPLIFTSPEIFCKYCNFTASFYWFFSFLNLD